jgi:serine/threonine protein kinase
MHATGTDEQDGEPIWLVAEDADLVPGVAAIHRIAVGTRCETWLGWSRSLWCPVEVKLARPAQLSRALRSLGREVAALDRHLHPAWPRLYADHRDGEIPCLVTELIDGPGLDEVADEGRVDVAAAALIAVELLGAVRALHRRGLAHLDAKPENVIVRDGRAILIDFGSARPLGRPQPAGYPIGTEGFAAPELAAGDPIAAGMDVFGVGATVLAALAADPVSPTTVSADAVRAARPEVMTEPGAEELLAALAAMTAPDPSARPDVSTALRSLADLFDPACRPWPAGLIP